MKKHLSILFLAARSTLVPILAVLGLMVGAETLLFWLALRGMTENVQPMMALLEQSRIGIVCAVAFVLVCVLLAFMGTERSSNKLGYTLRRLRVRERTVVLWWWLYAVICLVLFWAVQAVTALLFCHWYTAVVDPALWNAQTVLLESYRTPLLHGLLPLAEVSLWVRNGFLLAALGLCTARASYQMRRGQKPVALTVLVAATVVMFPTTMGQTNVVLMFCTGLFFMIVYALYQLFAEVEG